MFDRRKISLFTIVDNFTRASVAIEAGQRMRGQEKVEVFERIAYDRKLPISIRFNLGPELAPEALD